MLLFLLTLTLQPEQLEEISKPIRSNTSLFHNAGPNQSSHQGSQAVLPLQSYQASFTDCTTVLKLWPWPSQPPFLFVPLKKLNSYFLRPQALCTHYSLSAFSNPSSGWLLPGLLIKQGTTAPCPLKTLHQFIFIYLIPCKAHTLGGSKSFCKGPDGPGCSSVLYANKPLKRVNEELRLGSNKTLLTKIGSGLALDSRPLFASPRSISYCL